jgi:catechol 2,3-dioxygenase
VSDIDRSRAFYERAIGLRATELDDGTIGLGPTGGPALVELRGDSSAPRLNRRAPGLYHLAILLPTRLDLAFALARLVQTQWPLDGASDHLVSEALYLSDPDGNGIEIYCDRPRADWRYESGQLQMSTLPLDLNDLVGQLRGATEMQAEMPAGTRIGHVHLQVSELGEAEAFYHGVLGFDVVVRGYPGALFVSAGGYHHHIGLNTWHSAGTTPAPAGSVGLRSFTVELPDQRGLSEVLGRVEAAGIPTAQTPDGVFVRDPFGNGVLLTAPSAQ